MPKPRMTRSDKWNKRPIVNHWNAYKDLVRLECNKIQLQTLPDEIISETFIIQMPGSWTEKKKKEMNEKPHQQEPDIDNIEKGIFDILCPDGDSHIWKTGIRQKIWGRTGAIILTLPQ